LIKIQQYAQENEAYSEGENEGDGEEEAPSRQDTEALGLQ
jgi:hypothetical protein